MLASILGGVMSAAAQEIVQQQSVGALSAVEGNPNILVVNREIGPTTFVVVVGALIANLFINADVKVVQQIVPYSSDTIVVFPKSAQRPSQRT